MEATTATDEFQAVEFLDEDTDQVSGPSEQFLRDCHKQILATLSENTGVPGATERVETEIDTASNRGEFPRAPQDRSAEEPFESKDFNGKIMSTPMFTNDPKRRRMKALAIAVSNSRPDTLPEEEAQRRLSSREDAKARDGGRSQKAVPVKKTKQITNSKQPDALREAEAQSG